jgi:hypothetical protein
MPEEPAKRRSGDPASGRKSEEPGHGGHVELSRWDTGMKMETTPQSAIDHWGEPVALSPVDTEATTPADSAGEQSTPPDPQDES